MNDDDDYDEPEDDETMIEKFYGWISAEMKTRVIFYCDKNEYLPYLHSRHLLMTKKKWIWNEFWIYEIIEILKLFEDMLTVQNILETRIYPIQSQ